MPPHAHCFGNLTLIPKKINTDKKNYSDKEFCVKKIFLESGDRLAYELSINSIFQEDIQNNNLLKEVIARRDTELKQKFLAIFENEESPQDLFSEKFIQEILFRNSDDK